MHFPTLLTNLFLAATIATAAELQIDVTHAVECNRKTTNGDNVKMHYRGTLADSGKQFDASYDRGTPLSFALGAGRVIKGFVLIITFVVTFLWRHANVLWLFLDGTKVC
jgi:FK506-binding protein 2